MRLINKINREKQSFDKNIGLIQGFYIGYIRRS